MFKTQVDPAEYYVQVEKACQEHKELEKEAIEGVIEIALDNGYTYEQAHHAIAKIGNKFTFPQLLFLFNCGGDECIGCPELKRILGDYGAEMTTKQVEEVFNIMGIKRMNLKAFEVYAQELFGNLPE